MSDFRIMRDGDAWVCRRDGSRFASIVGDSFEEVYAAAVKLAERTGSGRVVVEEPPAPGATPTPTPTVAAGEHPCSARPATATATTTATATAARQRPARRAAPGPAR